MSKRKSILLLVPLALLAFLPWSCTAPDPRIQKLVDQVDSATLMQHVQSLCDIGPRFVKDEEATDKSIAYLREQLEPLGYEILEEEWPVSDFKVRNLFASKKGESFPDRVIEVSAHYDSVRTSPGADDNASGVAGLLEVARLIADQKLEHTVRFCFFGGEEIGLVGSSLHVDNIGEHEGEVIGLINLEMIGYATDEPGTQETPIRIPLIASPPETGNFIIVIGNFGSGFVGNIFEGAADRYVPELEYFSLNRIGGFFGDAARSDHSQYWVAGIPAIMLADTANFRNPHYHQPTDVPETLNAEFMARVTKASLGAVLEWAGVMDEG